MARYFPFVPNVAQPFTFLPVLDERQYVASVKWNLYGQRWYITVAQQNGTPVFTKPVIGSPDGVSANSATWETDTVTLVTSKPHDYTVGQTVAITVSGFLPDAYNGDVLAFVVDPITLQYALQGNPGDVTQLGGEIYNINIAGGYFDTSKLIFRQSSQTFEVTP